MAAILRNTIVKVVLLFAFALSGAVAQENEEILFPLPAELEPDVNFWLSIFTEYSTREGVLHDNRFLGVVYEKVPLPEKVSRRERQRIADRRRQHYKRVLQSLATGKRDNLSADEERVLSLWPEDVTNQELSAAAGRIRLQLGL